MWQYVSEAVAESPGLLLGAPGGAGESGEQVEVVVVLRLRHGNVRRRSLRLQRREAPGLRGPRRGRRRQRRPERGRRGGAHGCVAFLALALPEDGGRGLVVVGGGGGRGGRGGGDEDGRGGAGARGGHDGRLGLAEQPLDGLPVRLEPQLAGELEHARRAHDRHAHAPPPAVHLAVPVLAAAALPLDLLRRGGRHHGAGVGRRRRGWHRHRHRLVDVEHGGGGGGGGGDVAGGGHGAFLLPSRRVAGLETERERERVGWRWWSGGVGEVFEVMGERDTPG